ncbi:DUF349 domain-containing protein [Marinobacter oulmenensis]|uniref:DUF349 domain-containing protein n=1 Tax=Marinobacter oulmenensis TaxID=643747 RepID=A0A840UF83_9GAMM|nr:DUF349 domain-containing protein [Marinobacter oulmenensis]MBB5322853.1 hypothetical protein [Marinobacter oulmenensis]
MAAFIQKLFKTRKATPVKHPSAPEPSESSRQETEEKRDNQRQQQSELLASQPSPETLAELATDGVTAAIRLEAARQLADEALLQQVQKLAKGRDKGVYQTVKQTLQAIREQQSEEAANQEKLARLIAQVKEQAISEDTKLYQARLEALLESWKTVEDKASTEQTQAFLEAVHQCRARLQQLQEAREEEQRHRDQAGQRHETLALLQRTLEDLKSGETGETPSPSALDALQKTQENRWLEATRDTHVEKNEQKNYEQAMQSLRSYLSAVRQLEQARTRLAEIELSEPAQQPAIASALLKDLTWPEGFRQPQSLIHLQELAGKVPTPEPTPAIDREKLKALVDELAQTLAALDAALDTKQHRESRQLLKQAQNLFQKLQPGQRRQFQARMHLLAGQFRELDDWQGFATEPKQVSLCEQMEYLAEQPMEPEAKAERIKELQNEWRDLGGSSNRPLWERFKSASDRAYEPCKAYFEAKSDLKKTNLEKRQAICDQLAAFVEEADWDTIDWKAAEQIHQTARQEWKEAWPIDFRDNRQVQKRFDSLLKQLERPLNEERQKNEALKKDIVEKAQALVDHEPLQEAMDEAKALQSQWKAVGITRHREDRKLWKAFRRACDDIFARREAHRSNRQRASEEADEAARELLRQYANLHTGSDDITLQQAREALARADATPLGNDMRQQVQQLCQQVNKLVRSRELSARIAGWQTLIEARASAQETVQGAPDHWPRLVNRNEAINARDLVIRAEILAGADTPAEDQGRRMELQVERLAQGMGAGSSASSPLEELEKLVAHWCLLPGLEDATAEYAGRLSRALEALNQAD